MTKRRLSQAISEGDGISIIVGVESADAARDAEAAGAEGVLVSGGPGDHLVAIRAATELPILVVYDPERTAPEAADACIVDVDGEDREWLEHHLGRFGLADRFLHLVGIDHDAVTAGKPAPDLYVAAIAELGVDRLVVMPRPGTRNAVCRARTRNSSGWKDAPFVKICGSAQ